MKGNFNNKIEERARAREIKKGRELCRDVEIFSFCVLKVK